MKYMILLVVFSGLISTSKAQGVNFIISYPIAFPMGNTSDYVGKTSFRGASFEDSLIPNHPIPKTAKNKPEV